MYIQSLCIPSPVPHHSNAPTYLRKYGSKYGSKYGVYYNIHPPNSQCYSRLSRPLPSPFSLLRQFLFPVPLSVLSRFECETWVHSAHRSVLTLTDPPLHLAYLKGPSQYQSMRPPLYSPRCKFHSGPPQRRSNRAILTTDDRTVIVERGGIYRYTD
jgi:hypothetical protein